MTPVAMRLVPVDRSHAETFASWFSDPVLARRVDAPSDAWFAHVARPSVIARVGLVADRPVGVVQCDVVDGIGAIAIWIDPALRRTGTGSTLLRAFLAVPAIAALRRIDAHLEPDNLDSQRCITACGFHEEGRDADGLLRYARDLPTP